VNLKEILGRIFYRLNALSVTQPEVQALNRSDSHMTVTVEIIYFNCYFPTTAEFLSNWLIRQMQLFGTWLASGFGVAAQNSSAAALFITSWNDVLPPM